MKQYKLTNTPLKNKHNDLKRIFERFCMRILKEDANLQFWRNSRPWPALVECSSPAGRVAVDLTVTLRLHNHAWLRYIWQHRLLFSWTFPVCGTELHYLCLNFYRNLDSLISELLPMLSVGNVKICACILFVDLKAFLFNVPKVYMKFIYILFLMSSFL